MMRRAGAAVLVAALLALSSVAAKDVFPSRTGLFVGTRENKFDNTNQGKDVVYNGNQTSWTNADKYQVADLVNYVDLYLSLEAAPNMSLFQTVTITSDTDDIFLLQVFNGPDELVGPQDVNLSVGHENEVRLHAVIDCTNTTQVGEGEIGIEIANFTSHVLLFTYNCTDALNYAYGFGVSTAKNDPQGTHVVENGRTVNDYAVAVGPEQDSIELYAYLDTLAPIGDVYKYNIVADTFEELLDVTVTPESGQAGNGPRTPFMINFACDPDHYGENRNASVTVTFIFPEEPGHKTTEDATFDLVKECKYLPRPPSGGGGGWSPFGIFAFTVFMITFVFCVAGCVVNRFHFHKQGADIVPCMPLFRRIVGGGSQGVYTPQAELEDGATSTGAGATAYGSYEENSNL